MTMLPPEGRTSSLQFNHSAFSGDKDGKVYRQLAYKPESTDFRVPVLNYTLVCACKQHRALFRLLS